MPATCRLLDFDIDHYLNRFVAPSFLHRLPKPLAHFLGYRAEPPQYMPHLIIWAWSFMGTLGGLCLLGGTFRLSPWIRSLNAPVILPSYGAAAILEYSSIESPLAQPRNLIIGQALSATVGVGITKLFQFLPTEQFLDLRWIIGSLNVAVASVVMGVTKTIHPPAGASALLAGTDLDAIAMGWSFIPLVLVCDCLTLASALLINNLQRRFPQYWWTPQNVGSPPDDPIVSKGANDVSELSIDPEQAVTESFASSVADHSLHEIKITALGIEVPDWLVLEDIERDLLRNVHGRLRKHHPPKRTQSHLHGTHSVLSVRPSV